MVLTVLALFLRLAAAQGPAPAVEASFRPVRPPVLGFELEGDGTRFRLVEVDGGRIVAEGGAADCESALVAALEARYGRGKPNLALPTFGGVQFWGDVLWLGGWRIQENALTGACRLLDPGDVRRAWGSFEACRTALEAERLEHGLPAGGPRLVILLHGLARSRASCEPMAQALEEAGFAVAALAYPSTRRSIREHAEQVHRVLDGLEGVEEVSFVSHSLGGLVARQALALPGSWREHVRIGRMVMLAPPSHGSALAASLKDWLPFRVALGPSLRDVAEEAATIPPPPCPFAIVAAGHGERGWNPLLQGNDDGLLTVEETRLEGAAEFRQVEGLHASLIRNPQAVRFAVEFLDGGEEP